MLVVTELFYNSCLSATQNWDNPAQQLLNFMTRMATQIHEYQSL